MGEVQQRHWPYRDVLEAIRTRRSVRKYTGDPVEWDKIGTIVDAGRVAPSTGNLQCWRFIVIEAHAKRRQIAEACMKQYWMEEAPVQILIVAMLKKIKEFYGKRGTHLYAVQESAMAAENMMLAAHALGLGSCFVSAMSEAMVSEALSLPDDIRPMGVVTLGYPAEQPPEPLKYRMENVTFMGRWGQQNIARIKDVDNVIWNFRVAERGIKLGSDVVNAVDQHTRHGRKKLADALRKKAEEVQQRIEEGRKKQP